MMESGPLDLDLMAWSKGYAGSNLDRGFRIGRLGLVGCAGGGGNTPATKSRGGVARGSPDFTINGAPGVKSTRAWARGVQRDMRDRPWAFADLGVLWACGCNGGGGSARWGSSASARAC
jgi:hypothetical protein